MQAENTASVKLGLVISHPKCLKIMLGVLCMCCDEKAYSFVINDYDGERKELWHRGIPSTFLENSSLAKIVIK